MRRPDLGLAQAPTVYDWLPLATAMVLFYRMAYARAVELKVLAAQDAGAITTLIYSSLGQEAIPAAISAVSRPGSLILGQHRGHAAYLAFGGSPEALRNELKGLPTGCCGGKGGSPMIHDVQRGIIGHIGLIGDQVPVACGMALASKRPVICFMGDGAAEEDYVLSALGFASTHKLGILFVVEDNDLSVLTPTAARRSWDIVEVARGFRMRAYDIADDPWLIAWYASLEGPTLLNVRTCRERWHNGTGTDGPPEWDRYALTRAKLRELGIDPAPIEKRANKAVEVLWS